MRTTAAFLSLTVLAVGLVAAAPPAAAQYGPAARIWVDNDREFFRHGDRLRVNFSTSANSYVAIVHVDPDGYLDFVYPRSPWDNEFVRAGRIHSLDRSGWNNGLLVRGGSGIGYLYVIASPVPLDYSRFASGPGSSWDWSYAGRQVSGDPFWAMEQITRLLLPRWSNVPYSADYYTYFVGGRQRYPSYACSSYGDGLGWGYSSAWSSYYGSCNRLDLFLRDNPYYFDSRRFRGDRARYYRDYRDARDWDPRHRYKADPESPAARPAIRAQTPSGTQGAARALPRQTDTTSPVTRPAQRAAPERDTQTPAGAATTRPTQRAAPAPRAAQPTPQRAQPTPQRAQPTPRTRPEPRTRSATPRAEPATRSSTPAARPASSSERGSSTSTPRSRRGD